MPQLTELMHILLTVSLKIVHIGGVQKILEYSGCTVLTVKRHYGKNCKLLFSFFPNIEYHNSAV